MLMSTNQNLIDNWGDGSASRVRTELTRFRHRLAETGLFEDEALASLLDRHPRADTTICTMRPNPPPGERWIAGEANGVDGAQLLQAVRTGALWISPRQVVKSDPVYAPVFNRLMSEYSKATGLTIPSASASLLISGPRMGIFLHVDTVDTMLWHIRGHKTIYVYPPREDYVTEAALEAILLKENLSDLPYFQAMEEAVKAVRLAPGDAVAWPLHSPHRVVNGDDLNVSLSIEYATPRSALMNGVFYVNGRLRRLIGHAPRSRAVPAFARPAYFVAAKALKTLAPLSTTIEQSHERLFDVDLRAPGCIAWRDQAGVRTAAAA